MFPMPRNQEDELNPDFTALSLSTGVPGTQRRPIPSPASNKVLSTGFALAKSCENPCDLQESVLMKHKRQRRLDLSIGTGSSPSQLETFGAGCVVHEGECSTNKQYPIDELHGVGNASEVTDTDKASPYPQPGQGLIGNENGNSMSEHGGAAMCSSIGRNDFITAKQCHQSLSGVISENVNKVRAYGRGNAGFRDVTASEKLRYRMIKNRESAARSRARRQAQEAQQQLENVELKEENEVLKRVVRFLLAIVRTKHMKLPAQSRSFSGPL